MADSQSNQITGYAELLKKFNPAINLLSRKDMDNLMTRHIDDGIFSHKSLSAFERLSSEYPVYDLGSGNGIPGVIWAILSPETKFILVDTDERKCEFLKTAASRLGISNVTVDCVDFKSIQPTQNSLFLCRGLTALESFFSENSAFNNHKGYFIKGSTWNIELGQLKPEFFTGLPYKLKDGTERALVIYKK